MENLIRRADGSARCGACMQTFKVFDHLKNESGDSGGLLVNPQLAQSRGNAASRRNKAGAARIPSLLTREREDGRVEPVLLGADLASDGPRFTEHLQVDPIDMRPRDAGLAQRIATAVPSALAALFALVLGWLIYLQWFEVEAHDLPDNAVLQAAHRYACTLLRCGQASESTIVSRQLLVYSHPQRDNALLVETVIVNLGKRARPFPRLKLEFEDFDGAVVASRIFSPAEYLAGELAGKREIAAQTPVQIELEIVDPGAQAVNYRLDILPAN